MTRLVLQRTILELTIQSPRIVLSRSPGRPSFCPVTPTWFKGFTLILLIIPIQVFSLPPLMGSGTRSESDPEIIQNLGPLSFVAPQDSEYLPFGLSLGIQAGMNGLAIHHPLLGQGLYPQAELGFRLGLDFRLVQFWGMSFHLLRGYQLPLTLGNQIIIPRGLEYLEGQLLLSRYVPFHQSWTKESTGSPTLVDESSYESSLRPHSFRPHIQGLSLRAGIGLVYANYLYTQVFLWYPSLQVSVLAWSQPIAGLPLGFLIGPELSLGLRRDPGITVGAGFLFQIVLPF